ncbi:MAG: hypothetical protein K2L19_08365 [Eubacterium sp.]|nr:hypothetical protein [Eubacterium sp.]
MVVKRVVNSAGGYAISLSCTVSSTSKLPADCDNSLFYAAVPPIFLYV